MIYDGHAYCIPDLTGDGGFESREEFQRLLQFITAHHFQPAWRVRDRAPGDNHGLADLSRPFDLDAVKPARFRATANGRLEWESDGEVYCKQMLPPLITDMSYDADRTVAEMDYAGVDWALLHRTPYLGIDNDFFADCCRRHPERLQGLAYVREWTIPGDPDGAVRELDRAINALGLHGLQFLPYFSVLHGITEDWDRGRYEPFWDVVADLRIPVFFTFISQQEKTVEGYLAQLQRLRRWMERYPDVDAVLTHGFDWLRFLENGELRVPDAVYEAAPCDNPRFRVQILFAVFLGVVFDYPMLQFKPTLGQMIERLGPERIIWGTDVPILMRYTTYRQSLDQIRLYCQDLLGEEDMACVLGRNMARLMGLEPA